LLSKAAYQQGIKVLLNGAGGDELFGGYDRHWLPRFGSPAWVASLPRPVRNLIAGTWSLIQPERSMRASDPIYAWGCGISGANLYLLRSLLRSKADFNDVVLSMREEYAGLESVFHKEGYSYARMKIDLQRYLPEDVLALTDKATMATSVEGRVPLLDHRLVEFAFSLPPEINLLQKRPKGLLRSIMKHRLPEDLLNRKKEGFNVHITEWMMQGNGIRIISNELIKYRTSILDEMFDTQRLDAFIMNPAAWHSASETLYALFLFNRWFRMHSAE